MNKLVLAFCLALAAVPLSVEAGARRFTFVYEATTGRAGSVDVENWLTFAAHTPNEHDFRAAAFRHEIEIGITDRLQASIYLADWQYERSQGARYTASALELIYNLSNPVADPVGIALYQEYKFGGRFFEWESKVIAQKNIGRVVAAYNATLEAIWQGDDLRERSGELQQSLGISYELNPRFALGVEILHEVEIPDWRKANRGFLFAGPNASVRAGNVWATVTALAQVTSAGGEPDLQVRTIFGVMF